MFTEGQLPQIWKDTIVTPLHKKGEKELLKMKKFMHDK